MRTYENREKMGINGIPEFCMPLLSCLIIIISEVHARIMDTNEMKNIELIR